VIPRRPPGGLIWTLSLVPSFASPTTGRMKGFQSLKASKSVSAPQTASGEAEISISLFISLLNMAVLPLLSFWSDRVTL
jgi:hypothetical protein